MNFFRFHPSRYLVAAVLAVLGAILCALLLPGEIAAVRHQVDSFPDSDTAAHLARPWILGVLCFIPFLATLVYSFGSILDRYLAKQFVVIFGISIAALFIIWVLVDLNGKLGDFQDSPSILVTALKFYAARSPAVFLLLLPYALLLSLIYCLGKFSREREIISMIQGGRGIIRITLPLIIAGAFCTLICLGLNYHWAPTAEGEKNDILARAQGKPIVQATNVLYLNSENRRLWRIGSFPQNYEMGEPLQDVEVTTRRDDYTLESRLFAKRALWDRDNKTWTFEDASIGHYRQDHAPIFDNPETPIVQSGWSETPWQLIKPGLDASVLGLPDLNGWLKSFWQFRHRSSSAPYLTHWHYRIALPFTCLITVLLATPLSIHFARRGPGGSVFLAVVFSALMMLFSTITLSLGEAAIVPPLVAAWLPNLFFGLLGLYLFQRRISGRPIYQSLRRFLSPAN